LNTSAEIWFKVEFDPSEKIQESGGTTTKKEKEKLKEILFIISGGFMLSTYRLRLYPKSSR
jgi:hypothetical protein